MQALPCCSSRPGEMCTCNSVSQEALPFQFQWHSMQPHDSSREKNIFSTYSTILFKSILFYSFLYFMWNITEDLMNLKCIEVPPKGSFTIILGWNFSKIKIQIHQKLSASRHQNQRFTFGSSKFRIFIFVKEFLKGQAKNILYATITQLTLPLCYKHRYREYILYILWQSLSP